MPDSGRQTPDSGWRTPDSCRLRWTPESGRADARVRVIRFPRSGVLVVIFGLPRSGPLKAVDPSSSHSLAAPDPSRSCCQHCVGFHATACHAMLTPCHTTSCHIMPRHAVLLSGTPTPSNARRPSGGRTGRPWWSSGWRWTSRRAASQRYGQTGFESGEINIICAPNACRTPL